MNIQNTATKKSPLDLRDYAAVIGIDWADQKHALATVTLPGQEETPPELSTLQDASARRELRCDAAKRRRALSPNRQIAERVRGGLSCHARLPELHPAKISVSALASRSIAFGKM